MDHVLKDTRKRLMMNLTKIEMNMYSLFKLNSN